MNNKYPTDLFIVGFILNVFVKYFFLFFSATALLIIGFWIKSCLIIGLLLLSLDIILSLVEQLRIRKTTLNSDDPNFTEFQDAVLSNDWKNNIQKIIEDKANEYHEDDE